MISSKRLLIIIFLLILIVLAILYFLFFQKKELDGPVGEQNNADCLIFQNLDPLKPCYMANGGVFQDSGTQTTENPDTVSSNDAPTVILTSSEKRIIESCESLGGENSNTCIKKAAVESKKTQLCSGITGALNRADCVSSVGHTDTGPKEVFSQPTLNQTAINSSFSATSTASAPQRTVSSILADTLSSIRNAFSQANKNPDTRYTIEGFNERFAAGAGLRLYAFSETQAAPGSALTAQGAGFSKTGNVLHIGGSTITGLDSADGFSLNFTVPSMNNGTYEAWVENEKGSSRRDSQRIILTVTNFPAPRPVITRVSPEIPLSTDTLTFYGDNLGSSVMVISTLGMKQNVPSNGGSFSLKLSDLPYFNKVKNSERMKGMRASFFVHVQNENGVTRQPFTFDVQF